MEGENKDPKKDENTAPKKSETIVLDPKKEETVTIKVETMGQKPASEKHIAIHYGSKKILVNRDMDHSPESAELIKEAISRFFNISSYVALQNKDGILFSGTQTLPEGDYTIVSLTTTNQITMKAKKVIKTPKDTKDAKDTKDGSLKGKKDANKPIDGFVNGIINSTVTMLGEDISGHEHARTNMDITMTFAARYGAALERIAIEVQPMDECEIIAVTPMTESLTRVVTHTKGFTVGGNLGTGTSTAIPVSVGFTGSYNSSEQEVETIKEWKTSYTLENRSAKWVLQLQESELYPATSLFSITFPFSLAVLYDPKTQVLAPQKIVVTLSYRTTKEKNPETEKRHHILGHKWTDHLLNGEVVFDFPRPAQPAPSGRNESLVRSGSHGLNTRNYYQIV